MLKVFPTATLRQLARHRRAQHDDLVPGADAERVAGFLRLLLAHPEGVAPETCPDAWIAALEERFLIAKSETSLPQPGLPFAFATAVNFELTYGCNLGCRHCLQEGLRPTGDFLKWIETDLVVQALTDASWLGLLKAGVNFTGGEVYLPGSAILTLIERAADLGINSRCNTNAWWGGRSDFTVGQTRFESDTALLEKLQAIGLSILVMSLDDRYSQYPELLDRVLRVAAGCERIGLFYEFVATSPTRALVQTAFRSLLERIGRQPRYLIVAPMDTVDIGAAAGPGDRQLEPDLLGDRTRQSPCQRKGFHRPYYLHVNPRGGVRTCLYAPGAGALGDLTRERLPQLLNKADRNAVVRLFADGEVDEFVARNITPWSHVYRNIEHPCAASALVARVAGAVAEASEREEGTLTEPGMEKLHRRIATEWNVRRQ